MTMIIKNFFINKRKFLVKIEKGKVFTMRMLYPSSMLNSSKVDEHFEQEYEKFEQPALVSLYENKILAKGQSLDGETLFYRGWILSPEEYEQLNKLVESKNAQLMFSTQQYVLAQFANDVNGWLKIFKNHTPETMVYPYYIRPEKVEKDFENVRGRFVVKGASKSLKGDWKNSAYASSWRDLSRIVSNFKEQVSEKEESHILVRAFEYFDKNEWRVWFFGENYLITDHPNNTLSLEVDERIEEYVQSLIPLVKELDAGFVTVDVVNSYTGLRVVEFGSGMVSGSSVDISEFIKENCCNE